MGRSSATTRQMRPRSFPSFSLRSSICFVSHGTMKITCSMIPWYMSAMYRAPSGPTRAFTGRNRSSVDARNSCSGG